jgi:hypothetical protein
MLKPPTQKKAFNAALKRLLHPKSEFFRSLFSASPSFSATYEKPCPDTGAVVEFPSPGAKLLGSQ